MKHSILLALFTSCLSGLASPAAARNLLSDGSFEAIRQEDLAKHWYVEREDVYDGQQCLRFSSDEAQSGWYGSGHIEKMPLNSAHVYAIRYAAKTVGWTGPYYLKPFLRLRLYDRDGKYIKYQSAGGIVFARACRRMWITHIYYFTIPEGATQGQLEAEHYQCTGTVFIDAVSLVDLGPVREPRSLKAGKSELLRIPTPDTHPRPTFTEAQQKQGFVVFQRDEPGFIFPNSWPDAREIVASVETYAARGQHCGIGLAIYPLRDLESVELALSDLTGPGGRIARAGCSLRRVRYWPQVAGISGGHQFTVIPELLEPMAREVGSDADRFEPLPTAYDWSALAWQRSAGARFAAEEPQLIWLSADVPVDARAGRYTGVLRVRAKGLAPVEVGIVLSVLPFELERPRKRFQGFYLYDQRFDKYGDEQLEAEFREMHRFGAEAILLSLENVPKLGYKDGLKILVAEENGRRRVVGVSSRRLDRVLAAFSKVGLRGPIIIGYNPMISRHVARVLGRPKEEGADMTQWSPAVHQGMIDVFKGTSAIMAKHGQEKNWGMALKDEAQMPYKLHVQQEAMLAKKAGISVYFAGSTPVADHVAGNLDFLTYPRIYAGSQNAERLRWCRDHGVKYWFYEGGGYTNQDGKVFPNRYFSGFQLIKSGAQCHMGYTFQDGLPDPWNEFVSRSGMSWNTTYPLNPDVGWAEGPFLSTLQWEGYKQGYTDACYWATLQHYIVEAKKRREPALLRAAQEAEAKAQKLIAQVPWSIDCHYHYPSGPICAAAVPDLGFHNREADEMRRELADEIVKLRDLAELRLRP